MMANDAEKRLQQQAVTEAERAADKGTAPTPPAAMTAGGPPQSAAAPLPVLDTQPGKIAAANRPYKQTEGTVELVSGITKCAMHVPKGSLSPEPDDKGVPTDKWVEVNFVPEGYPVKIPAYAAKTAEKVGAFHGS